jgi:hypothetical protein
VRTAGRQCKRERPDTGTVDAPGSGKGVSEMGYCRRVTAVGLLSWGYYGGATTDGLLPNRYLRTFMGIGRTRVDQAL